MQDAVLAVAEDVDGGGPQLGIADALSPCQQEAVGRLHQRRGLGGAQGLGVAGPDLRLVLGHGRQGSAAKRQQENGAAQCARHQQRFHGREVG